MSMKKIKNKYVKYSIVAVLIFLLTIIYRKWFYNFGILSKGDWGFYFRESLSTVRIDYFTTWLGDSSLGRVLVDTGQAPTYALYGLLAKYFGFSFALSERFVHMWPIVIIAPLGMYILMKYFTKSYIAIAIGVVLFSFNTYYLTLQTGHLTLAGAYAFIPLIYYSFIRYYEKPSFFLACIAAILMSLATAYEPRGLFVAMMGIAVYLLVLVVHDTLVHKNPSQYLKKFFLLFIPIIIFLFINLYWIIGIAVSGGGSSNEVVGGGLFGAEYFNLKYALTLYHPYWTGAAPESFVAHSIPIYYWVLPALIFISVYINKKDIKILGFAVVAIVGILLAKQSNLPFPLLYEWLYRHIPGFNAYRESSKFYSLIAISFSVLTAMLVDKIIKNKNLISKHSMLFKRYYRVVLISCIATYVLLISFINISPIVFNNFGTLFVNRNIPNGESKVKNLIQSDNSQFYRTLWIPTTSRWTYFTNIQPAESLSGLYSNRWQDFFSSNDNDIKLKISDRITSVLKSNQNSSYLNNAAIKYVVIPSRDTVNENDFFIHFGDDRQYYIGLLDNIPFLKKLDVGDKSVDVYENLLYRGYVNSIDNIYSINKTDSISDASYSFINKYIHPDPVFNFDKNSNINQVQDLSSILTLRQSADGVSKYTIGNKQSNIYINKTPNYYYETLNGKLKIISKTGSDGAIYINDNLINKKTNTEIASIPLTNSNDYFISNSTNILNLQHTDEAAKPLDSSLSTSVFKKENKNLLENYSFENYLWRPKVDDCNPYNNKSLITMSQSNDSTVGSKSLQLQASSHIACTYSPKVNVTGMSNVLLSFDYKVSVGRQVSYAIRSYKSDGTYTTNTNYLSVTDGSWRKTSKLINLLPNIVNVQLVLMLSPNDTSPYESTARFDNVNFINSILVQKIEPAEPDVEKYSLDKKTDNIVSLRSAIQNDSNRIINSSFKNGLWQNKVSDCNAYDSNPNIGMSLSNDGFNDNKSLELDAENHIACTSPKPVNVAGGQTYNFSFRYKSSNAKIAGYSVKFNDDSRTLYSNSAIQIKNSDWNLYAKDIKAPNDATSAIVTLYSYSDSSGGNKNVNLYDDVSFKAIPDLENKLFLVENVNNDLIKPDSINVISVKPTEKTIQVKNASGNFYMHVAETFDQNWKLTYLSHSNNLISFFKPYNIINTKHYNISGTNGWFVDVDALCSKTNYCTKTNNGYSFKIAMVFTPQKKMNYAIVISVISLVIVILFVILHLIQSKRKKL